MNDFFHGEGTLTDVKGYKYSGNWSYGKRLGRGEEVHVTGERFRGQFENNMYDGIGRLTLSSGHEMIGSFLKGKPNGVVQETNLKKKKSKSYYENRVKSKKPKNVNMNSTFKKIDEELKSIETFMRL